MEPHCAAGGRTARLQSLWHALLQDAGDSVPLTSKYVEMHRQTLVCELACMHMCGRRTHRSCTERNAAKEDLMVRPP